MQMDTAMTFDDGSSANTSNKNVAAELDKSSTTPTEDIAKQKAENAKTKEIYEIKKKHIKAGIYVYECWNCMCPMMMH